MIVAQALLPAAAQALLPAVAGGATSPAIGEIEGRRLGTVAPAAPARAATRRPRSRVLRDGEAASRVRRSPWEPRPKNAAANARVPTARQLRRLRRQNTFELRRRVTGRFRGTTDEILQWAAHKWGIDEDLVRAVAVVESSWRMSKEGDTEQPYHSFGLMQIKQDPVHRGTYPLSRRSTAFNADYYGAGFRHYYDGHATWVENQDHGVPYRSGDVWGAVGAWYAGRWHTPDAEAYVRRVRAELAARTWALPGF